MALREFNCWYWKINDRGKKLEKMNLYLELLIKIKNNIENINGAINYYYNSDI